MTSKAGIKVEVNLNFKGIVVSTACAGLVDVKPEFGFTVHNVPVSAITNIIQDLPVQVGDIWHLDGLGDCFARCSGQPRRHDELVLMNAQNDRLNIPSDGSDSRFAASYPKLKYRNGKAF